MDDFEVKYVTDIPNENTIVVTTVDELAEKWLSEAMQKYDAKNRLYSAFLNEDRSTTQITQALLDELADNPQNDLEKIKKINAIVKLFINSDDIIGKVDETIESNVNTEYRISYNNIDGKNKLKTKKDVENLIATFNDMVDVDSLISDASTRVYREGTCILYHREKNGQHIIDTLPLGIAYISDWMIGNQPCVLVDMEKLKSKLSKTYEKTKKKKPLFFSKMEEEIKSNYPPEVYEAYKAKEKTAKLNPDNTYVIRIGNLGSGKYGVTPIFRALSSALMLKTFEDSDRITAKSRAKKIIVQLLNKEMAGSDYAKDRFDLTAWCHENLCDAFKNSTVIVTGNPAVRDIKYVEPQTQLTDVDSVNEYRGKEMSCLGIGFLLDTGSQSISTANISVAQLLKTINKITAQVSKAINKFYYQLVVSNGYDVQYVPKIKILGSEQLENDVKIELATFMYNTLNCSRRTAYEMIGIDVDDEMSRRKYENDEEYDKIFSPRESTFTMSGKTSNDNGRPANSDNEDKQGYDKQRQKVVK